MTNAQSFSTPTSYPSVENPSYAAAADFDADGKIDLATPNSLTNSVTFAFNNGTGSFPSRITYNSDPNPGWRAPEPLAVGDFNGDGKPDVAVGNVFGGPLSQGTIGILLNNGDRTFAAVVVYDARSPMDVAVADVNGDGKLDVVAASGATDNVSALLGTGNGTFQAATTYPSADEPTGICVADFNGDAKPDLAVTHYSGNVLSILLGNGNGTFQAPVNYAAGTTPRGIVAKDLNGDSKQDLVVAVPNSSAVYVYIGNGNGTFAAAVPYVVGSGSDVALGDLNGDGKDDVSILTDNGNSLKVMRGNPDGTFQLPAITKTMPRLGPFSSTVADFDNDGRLDIATVDPVNDLVDVYLNSPTAQGAAFNATPFIPATNVLVATFKDYDAAKTAASFSATINWGDSTPSSAGTISANASGGFNVNGTHTYSTPGPYNVAVQVSDSSGNFANATGAATVGCGPTIVTNTNDSGDGSLRQTILGACAGSTITFAAGLTSGGPATITLTTGELLINKNLTINGPGANLLSVSGNNSSRIFNVQTGTVVIRALAIINGQITNAMGGSGAGVINRGALALISCAITNNTAGNGGGGVTNFADNAPATLTIINSTINGNSASSFGPGLLNTGNGGATLNLINSTVTNNGNGSFGGGIYNSGASGTATLNITNSTIAGNRVGSQGGGIYNFGNSGAGTVNLNNSIVAYNSVINTPSDISNFNGNLSGRNNIIESSADHTITGSNNSNVDPLLEKDGGGTLILKNNGGPAGTLLPRNTSPALTSGDNTLLPSDTFDLDGDGNTSESLPVDQRGPGFPRVVNTAVDIGALEVNYTFTVTAGTPQSAGVGTSFATQLQATVKESNLPQAGILIIFTAPASGPSGTFAGGSNVAAIATAANGIATAPVFTANNLVGSYNVTAGVQFSGLHPVTFFLANVKLTATVTLSNLTQVYDGTPKFVTASTSPPGLNVVITYTQNGQPVSSPTNIGNYNVSAVIDEASYEGSAAATLAIVPRMFVDANNHVLAIDSVTFVRDPFSVTGSHNFSSEQRTRVMIFTSNLGLAQPNADLVVTAGGIPLTVEAVGTPAGTPDISYIIVKLDPMLVGDVLLTITFRGATSSSGVISIAP